MTIETPSHEHLAVAQPAPGPPGPARRGPSWLDVGERFGLFLLLAAIILVFSLMHPSTFATVANWQTIVSSQSVTAVIALALMVPLLSGNFDLSVGSVALLSSILAAGLMARDQLPLVATCAVVIVVGLAIGAINGILVTRFELNGLIATLGSATVLGGVVSWYSNDQSIAAGISVRLTDMGTDKILGVPWLAVIAVVIALVLGYVITMTPFGRMLVAIGSSDAAARLVGVRVQRMVTTSYIVSGGMAAIAGILLLAQQGSANPGTDGISTLIPALAAVFLGASTWTPGRYNVVGTILGLLLVGVTVSGLTLSGAAPWVDPVCYGGALILAVGASAWFRRRRGGR